MATTPIWTGFYKPGVDPCSLTKIEDMARFRKNNDGTYTFQEVKVYYTSTSGNLSFDQIRTIMNDAPEGDDPGIDHYDNNPNSYNVPVVKFYVYQSVVPTTKLIRHVLDSSTMTW